MPGRPQKVHLIRHIAWGRHFDLRLPDGIGLGARRRPSRPNPPATSRESRENRISGI